MLRNLLQPGTIAAVDTASARVRVGIGALTTDWLPWFERRAGDIKTWSPPVVGEQCLVLAPCGELASALVLVGLPSTANPAPASSTDQELTTYPDGASTRYDHNTHTLTLTLPSGGTIHINADQATLNGNLHVTGWVHSDADMVASGISLVSHVHDGVTAGMDTTGAPQ